MPGFYAEIPTSFYFASYSFFIKSPRFGLWKADFATSRLLDRLSVLQDQNLTSTRVLDGSNPHCLKRGLAGLAAE
jgi:hypothetical protein